MASSYINNLRLAEMATGDASGTWGTVTNTNLTLIADALGFQSKTVASASTDTLTIPDGTETDNEAISLYVKLTGGNQACTITVGPNTVKKLWIIENATSQVITLTQGSGANVILAAGVTKMIYADGAGSGAALVDALVGLEVGTTLYVKNAGTGDGSTAQLFLQTAEADIQANDVLGKINFQAPNEGTGTDAILVAASIQAVSEGDFSSSSNASSIKFTTASSAAAAIGGTDGGEMSLLSNGALLIRDKRTNGAPTLSLESGRTDVSDGEVLAGIEMYAPVEASGTDAILVGAAIKAIADADFSSSSNATSLQFQTGASETATTKMTLSSSGALNVSGKITADAGIDIDNFNIDGTTIALSSGDMTLDGAGRINLDADDNGEINFKDGGSHFGRVKDDSDRFRIESMVQDKDMMFVGNDGGSEVTAMYLSMENAGAATFNAGITLNGDFITTTAGSNNFRAGSAALDNVQSGGDQNIAIGDNALTACTTGDTNIAIGYNALATNQTNINNVAIGSGSLQNNTGGSNIGIGVYAGHSNTSGTGAICIGHYAGIYATGAGNIAIGYLAGYSQNQPNKLQTGYGNILIGNQVSVAASDDYGCIVIAGVTGKGDTTGFLGATGGIYQGNNNASWSTTSDKRLKKNIVDSQVGLEEINKIKVREFEYRTEDEITELDGAVDKIDIQGVQVGVIAQEIQEVLPSVVRETSQGVLSVEPDNITWHLVKALQELSAKNDALEARLVTLEGA